MSRSNRKSTTASRKTAPVATTTTTSRSGGAPTRTSQRESLVHATRDISRYTFEYCRDHVSRKAGASYFRVEGVTSDEGIEMNLQEAQSLYNFLGKALAQ